MSAVDKDGNPVGPQPLDVAAVYAREIESLRAQLAESEARREQWRETSDVQERHLASLRAAHEAAVGRVKMLEEAMEKIATKHQAYDDPEVTTMGQTDYQIGVVDGHRCAATIAREALGRKGT